MSINLAVAGFRHAPIFDHYQRAIKMDGIGETFARRGGLIIEALSQNKHVISDKPRCTSLDELNRIEQLSATKGLKIGCMLDMRDAPQFIGLKTWSAGAWLARSRADARRCVSRRRAQCL